MMKIQQLYKAVKKTLKIDNDKFDDNFRFYPTQIEVQENKNVYRHGLLPPKTDVDLQYMIDMIKATDGGSDSYRY